MSIKKEIVFILGIALLIIASVFWIQYDKREVVKNQHRERLQSNGDGLPAQQEQAYTPKSSIKGNTSRTPTLETSQPYDWGTSTWRATYTNVAYGFAVKYPNWLEPISTTTEKALGLKEIVDFQYVTPRITEAEYCGFSTSTIIADSQHGIEIAVRDPLNPIYQDEDPESSFQWSSITPFSVGGFDGVLVIIPGSFASGFHFLFPARHGVVDFMGAIAPGDDSLCHAMLSTLRML